MRWICTTVLSVHFRMNGVQPSKSWTIFWYVTLIMIIQFLIYIVLPTEQSCCVRSSFPSVRTKTSQKIDSVYCYESSDGLKIVGEDEFYDSIVNLDASKHPITIADFQWIYTESVLHKLSLISLGDSSRRLYFNARRGYHGNYTEIEGKPLDALQRDIAFATKTPHYLQSSGGFPVPTLSPLLWIPKIFIHVLLWKAARKLTYSFRLKHAISSQQIYRQKMGLCVHCTYDCAGLPTPICPECGECYSEPVPYKLYY